MARTLVLAAVLILTLPAALAVDDAEAGQWVVLGEDGVIWVPATEPISPAYLPPEHLGAFHNYTEMTRALQALAADHPDLVTLVSLGESVEERAIWAVTLRAGPDDGRPAVLFDGAHHGDEVIGSEILVRYARALADGYPSTHRSREILENATVVIVPMVNPDGIARAHSSSYYADARKNARNVDLNRNYAATWGGPGASPSRGDATYRGEGPSSEPETQHMERLLASRNWTFYSSLHSGAEMILWPYGHTTQSPPEVAAYTRLGNELTALTSAPNGQVSRILYSVSGDSMDAAYINAGPYWKPLATSPETYQGSGSAYDWWYLFNPPDVNIPNVVARWTPFLDHLAKEAAHYAPAKLTLSSPVYVPGEPFGVDGSVQTPLKRPFISGSATLTPPFFVDVTTTNPISIGAFNGTKPLAWGLEPLTSGSGLGRVRVDAGPAGNVTRDFPILVTPPAIELSVSPPSAGGGQTLTATLRATSVLPLTGTATLHWRGALVDTRAVSLTGANERTWTVAVNVADAPPGPQPLVATLAYDNGAVGTVSDTQSVFVDRPFLSAARMGVPHPGHVGGAFVMGVSVTNTGTRGAWDVTLRETLPASFAPWLREASAEPIASPPPARVSVAPAGQIVLEWDVASLAQGETFSVELGAVPLRTGNHTLRTDVTYVARYDDSTYAYNGTLLTPQRVNLFG